MAIKTVRIVVAVAAMVLLLITNTLAWNEPDGFRGIKWGTPIDNVAKVVNSLPVESGPEGRLIAIPDKVGDVPVVLSLYFIVNKFEKASIEFDPKSFDKMVGIFFMRYGAPTDTTIAWMWLGKKAKVVLGHTNNMGFATVESAKWTKKENEEREKKVRETARDL